MIQVLLATLLTLLVFVAVVAAPVVTARLAPATTDGDRPPVPDGAPDVRPG